MAPKLRIPGISTDSRVKSDELARESVSVPLAIRVQEVVEVASAREGAKPVIVELAEPPRDGEDRKAGQVCEVELEGGITLWLRPGSLCRDFGAQRVRGAAPSGDEDVWDVAPTFVRPSAATRGRGAAQRIRRITIYQWERGAAAAQEVVVQSEAPESRGVAADGLLGQAKDAAIDLVAEKLAHPVARAVEDHQLKKNLGLYKLHLGGSFSMVKVPDCSTNGPILVFLHGTMSSCEGSFKGLWDEKNRAGAEVRAQLERRYVAAFAWEHRTLTESPIENALALAEMLPPKARLHLVSHSRGGLVGDLLCLGQRENGADAPSRAQLRELFEQASRTGRSGSLDDTRRMQAERFARLIEILEGKQVTVERFVRVACPARGTTLASGRLDRWLSVVKLLNDLVLPNTFPLQLLIALIAEHDDPSRLPGLEAMMPGSPLVRILNLPTLQVRADLSVISGDTEGRGLFGRLKELMLDQFFEDECDVVVNTGAMYGGVKRVGGGRFYLDGGKDVNHFSYFKNDETVRMLAAGLLRSDNAEAGFLPLAVAPEKEPARAVLRRPPKGPLPVVFVLPGIMGSTLEVDGDRIWLDKLDLMLGKFGKLAVDREVRPREPLEDYYGALMDYLRESHEVVPFPYDWRRSILDAGKALASLVSAKLDEIDQRGAKQPVRILAHSMGGLVARAMIAQKTDLWRRMTANEGGRLLMLGTPNGGSYEIIRLLTGYSSTLRQLALLDFTRSWKELLEIIVDFPGVLELLPIEDDYRFFSEENWTALKDGDDTMREYDVELPRAKRLIDARRTWETILSTPFEPDRVLYVAGQARQTPISWCVKVESDPEHPGKEHKALVFEATARGDGKVPWDTGIPQNVKTWYLPNVQHGDLPAHEEAFPAYLELLQNGTTMRLATVPPAGIRAAALGERTILVPELPPMLPDDRELAGSVLGGVSGRRRRKAGIGLPKATVSITHGDIGYARHPVVVGHYAGDTIVSAEDYLDRALGGRLRERHRLGLYPGRLGTCETVLNPDRGGKPAGAIVIGLGRVGELSPGGLQSAVTQAALQYAIYVAECQDGRFGSLPGVPRSAKITSLLIGTGAGGMTTRDSIEAILKGVGAANRLLHDQDLAGKVRIDAIELMELWQDVAIQAATELERALQDGPLADLFVWEDGELRTGEGGRRRVQFDEPPDWWHRLEIVHDRKKDELRFIALTDRARAEESLVTGQLHLAEDLIRQTIADTRRDSTITHALFEMLIPNRIKELAPSQYDVVLVVDEVSGRYPWELLEDRWSIGDRPVAVSSGMLRQFKTQTFRERPVSTLEDTALVVGDPLITGEAARMFPSLEGARREAVAVADLLGQNGFVVTRRIRSEAREIMGGLHDNGYRILHLAGHGVHDEELPVMETGSVCKECERPLPQQPKKVSGMVIGNGVYLAPGDVEQMRFVPELVFINCCHCGSVDAADGADRSRAYHRLAANLAAQFIRMGVKAVVAAGWAVDDAAAETFATAFYRQLLASDKFGEAVRAAREETFDRHGATNTWGAYQCYGDPGFRLRPRKGPKRAEPRPKYLSPAQVVMDLENLANQVRMGGGSVEEVEAIVQAVKDKNAAWLDLPETAAALGLAYGELGRLQQAIHHLDAAMVREKAEFPMRALEQRANFAGGWAVELKRGSVDATGGESPDDLIRKAISDLEVLVSFGKTAERLSLLGRAHKRRAWITEGTERRDALAKMAAFYKEAHEMSCDEKRNRLDTCPLLNWLTAEVLKGWLGQSVGPELAEIREWCARAGAHAEAKDREDPSFWNSVVKPHCDLILALAEGTIDSQKQTIIEGYRQAKGREASPRQFRSVMEHLEFLATLAEQADAAMGIQAQATALREIVEQLAPT